MYVGEGFIALPGWVWALVEFGLDHAGQGHTQDHIRRPPRRTRPYARKSKSRPPKSVAIKTKADRLFSVSYGRF
jgi:hypothetical protein